MANFDELVQKTAETAQAIAGRSSGVIKKVTDGAKTVARAGRYNVDAAAEGAKAAVRIGRLNIDIAAERDAIRRNYAAIGKLYYELHRDSPEEALEQAVADIRLSEERIAEMYAEIDGIKNGDIEVEIIEEAEISGEEKNEE